VTKILTPAQAAYGLKRNRQKLNTLAPEMQQEVRRLQRFNGGAVIAEARKQNTVHHRPQRPAMLRRIRTA
jgi:hypothetical protein